MAPVCVLEINDSGLTVTDQTNVRCVSPGYIVERGDTLLSGQAAARQLRINPRASHDRFWVDLDQEPLARPAGPATSRADLAYFHLRDVWAPWANHYERAHLIVTPDLQRASLSLLCGIAQSCGVPLAGLVAAPVALAGCAGHQGRILVLDAQLHRMTATVIEVSNRAHMRAVEVVSDRGLSALNDAWSQLIAERFLSQTRLDPLRTAATEQQLYAALPGWLEQLAGQEQIRLVIDTGGHRYRIEMARGEFEAHAADHYADLLAHVGSQTECDLVLVHPRLAGLPGLLERLADCGRPIRVAPTDRVARYVIDALEIESADSDAPMLHPSLPAGLVSGARPRVDRAPEPVLDDHGASPTHVLHRGRVWPLNAGGLSFGADGIEPGSAATPAELRILAPDRGLVRLEVEEPDRLRVNEQSFDPARRPLAGDRIEIAGERLELIRIEPADET